MPLALFVALAIALGWGLTRDAREIPSALIGKVVPEFALPAVQGRTLGLSTDDLRGEVSLVNVFASWCVACRAEHPLLMRLAAEGRMPIHGLNYKDQPEQAAQWLDRLGDPYTRTGADLDGRVARRRSLPGDGAVRCVEGRRALPHLSRDRCGPTDTLGGSRLDVTRGQNARRSMRRRRC